jgi:hypothetical protein
MWMAVVNNLPPFAIVSRAPIPPLGPQGALNLFGAAPAGILLLILVFEFLRRKSVAGFCVGPDGRRCLWRHAGR